MAELEPELGDHQEVQEPVTLTTQQVIHYEATKKMGDS